MLKKKTTKKFFLYFTDFFHVWKIALQISKTFLRIQDPVQTLYISTGDFLA